MRAVGVMKVKVICDWCGKGFMKKASGVRKNNYCSRGCLGKANGERQKKEHPMKCSNCGVFFDYKGRHRNRNKHFFCSYDCYIDFKTKQREVICDWCGKKFLKKESDIRRTKHNFCTNDCELEFRRKEGESAWNHRVEGKVVHRRIAEEKIGRELKAGEHVHHIDGNHFNNTPENIAVLSASEHSKLHASWKRRNKHGQFAKA